MSVSHYVILGVSATRWRMFVDDTRTACHAMPLPPTRARPGDKGLLTATSYPQKLGYMLQPCHFWRPCIEEALSVGRLLQVACSLLTHFHYYRCIASAFELAQI
jgi:hypothetical protein